MLPDAGASASGGSHLPGDIAGLYDFPADLRRPRRVHRRARSSAAATATTTSGATSPSSGSPAPRSSPSPWAAAPTRPAKPATSTSRSPSTCGIAGAIAPGARIAAYFCEWTEKGWIDALETAIHDRENCPSILSISWGWAELEAGGNVSWTESAINAVNTSLQEAALLGVTVLCASGDAGSAAAGSGAGAHVDFPASSPYVLSCGGTTLRVTATGIDEVTWNAGARTATGGGATGGGVSELNPLPTWQAAAGVPTSLSTGRQGRGVPDIAGDADRATGYTILVDGQEVHGVGGTSAVAPLYAGLLARINQRLGKPMGYLNPLLYEKLAHVAFRDVVVGSNDCDGAKGYQAGKGWDACTGWGSIVGSKLLVALLDEAPPSTEEATEADPESHRTGPCSSDALPQTG